MTPAPELWGSGCQQVCLPHTHPLQFSLPEAAGTAIPPKKNDSSELRGSPWLPVTCRVTARHRHVLGLRQPPAAAALPSRAQAIPRWKQTNADATERPVLIGKSIAGRALPGKYDMLYTGPLQTPSSSALLMGSARCLFISAEYKQQIVYLLQIPA